MPKTLLCWSSPRSVMVQSSIFCQLLYYVSYKGFAYCIISINFYIANNNFIYFYNFILSQNNNKLPDPFIIPRFRKTTKQNLAKKLFYADDRKYMVRVLATMILLQLPTNDCDHVAKALVRKYPFLKEYVS